jgi:hypothetical protein
MSAGLVAIGPCYLCGRPFPFNPDLVPSLRVDPATNTPPDVGDHPGGLEAATARSVARPLCEPCVGRANKTRARMGLPPIEVLASAYQAQEQT